MPTASAAGSLRGGAATKVVAALLSRGPVREEVTENRAPADAAMNTIWCNDDDGRGVLLSISVVGLEALGIEPEGRRSPRPHSGAQRAVQAR